VFVFVFARLNVLVISNCVLNGNLLREALFSLKNLQDLSVSLSADGFDALWSSDCPFHLRALSVQRVVPYSFTSVSAWTRMSPSIHPLESLEIIGNIWSRTSVRSLRNVLRCLSRFPLRHLSMFGFVRSLVPFYELAAIPLRSLVLPSAMPSVPTIPRTDSTLHNALLRSVHDGVYGGAGAGFVVQVTDEDEEADDDHVPPQREAVHENEGIQGIHAAPVRGDENKNELPFAGSDRNESTPSIRFDAQDPNCLEAISVHNPGAHVQDDEQYGQDIVADSVERNALHHDGVELPSLLGSDSDTDRDFESQSEDEALLEDSANAQHLGCSGDTITNNRLAFSRITLWASSLESLILGGVADEYTVVRRFCCFSCLFRSPVAHEASLDARPHASPH